MTAEIIPFPQRRRSYVMHSDQFPQRRRSRAVRILREGPAWLVIHGEHGWLHGSLGDAAGWAIGLADELGVAIAAEA